MKARLLRLLFWASLVGAPVAACLFRVWVHHDAVYAGYRLSEAEAERRELRRVEHQLEVELAAERSPERLTRLARKLGLTPPSPGQLRDGTGRKGGDR